ncbi:uncharacterized protein LOC100118140 [Nasonia vitripennis]|uniref:Uncharacterized protein n=1 Tax=Nasonia vitripennis TaxID=7425 RepID=A0A7M7G485_NASVI|nr:uncharacterized protein LOC100118140 [Nasonia vitripennis]
MSEAQANPSNNAGGDSVEAKSGLQENAEPSPACQRIPLEEPAQNAACQIERGAGGDGLKIEKDNNANTKEAAEANNNNAGTVFQLQDEVLKRTQERDSFRKKLEEAERKISALQSTAQPANNLSNGSSIPDEGSLRRELDDLKSSLAQTKLVLDDRERRVANQENQISALSKQVSSLKEVVAITKDMLNIRNMEVKHLQEDVDKMESKITAERERHNSMLNKMDAAVRLNADLKKEYQTQLQLFQDLRGKYEEKVTLLSEENKSLESAVQAQPAQ